MENKTIIQLSVKKFFTIKDLCIVTNKKSDTIRKWEKKGIISKCQNYYNTRRQYNRKEFINILQEILDYKWQRNVIYNKGQILLLINNLKKMEEDN